MTTNLEKHIGVDCRIRPGQFLLWIWTDTPSPRDMALAGRMTIPSARIMGEGRL